jgi:hypothetical protein
MSQRTVTDRDFKPIESVNCGIASASARCGSRCPNAKTLLFSKSQEQRRIVLDARSAGVLGELLRNGTDWSSTYARAAEPEQRI